MLRDASAYSSERLEKSLPSKNAEDANKILNLIKAANETVEECLRKADKFTDNLDTSRSDNPLNNAIKDLNPNLQDKIENVRKNVKHERGRLHKFSEQEKEELKETEKEIKRVLGELKCNVDSKISKQVKDLISKLRVRVEEISKMLQGIDKKLRNYIYDLGEWIAKSNGILEKAVKKVTEILNEVSDGDGTKKPRLISEAAELMRLQADLLYNAGEEAKKQVAEKVKTALEAVKAMDAAVKFGLNDAKAQLLTVIGKYFQGYVGLVQTKVKEIKGEKGTEGLQKIETEVRKWAEEFKGDKAFGEKVKEWVEEILRDNEIVKNLFKTYVNIELPAKINLVADVFKKELVSGFIDKAGQRVQEIIRGDGENKIQTYVTAVQSGCQTFTTLLGAELKESGQAEALAKKIATAIQSAEDIVMPDKKSSPIMLLTNGVKYALNQLVAKARQTAADLGWFIAEGTAKGNTKNIDAALKVATDMDTAFKTALLKSSDGSDLYETANAYDPYGTAHKQTVQLKHNIQKTISEILKKEVGQEDGGGATGKFELSAKNFTQYKLQVDQDPSKLTEAENLAGALPNAIRKIKEEVEGALTNIGDFTGQAAENFGNLTNALGNLCHAIREAAGKENVGSYKESIKAKIDELQKLINNDSEVEVTINGKNHKQKGLTKIKKDLEALQDTLVKEPIKKTTELLSFITTAERQTISILKEGVETECKSAEEKLIHHAQKQYVNSLKALLTAFSDKLGKDLHGLPREIAGDLEIGHKGFMAKFEEHFIKYEKSIESIKSIKITHAPGEKSPLSQAAIKLATAFRRFLQHLQKQPDFTSDITKINPVHGVLTKLLTDLNTSNHFDHEFTKNLHELHSAVAAFKPSTYGEAKSPLLLNALRNGFSDLVEQLKNAYVSVYDDANIDWDGEHNPEKGMCAKVCLSIVPALFTALTELKKWLEKSNSKRKTYTIYNAKNPNHSLHSRFLRENGYDSDLPDDAEYGELNHKKDFTGQQIYKHLVNDNYKLFSLPSSSATGAISGEPTFEFTEENGVLSQLHHYLKLYFNICHTTYIDKPRTPCNVYEMLLWCSGLQFNGVYDKLREHCDSLFEKKPDERNPEHKIPVPIAAHPKPISRDNVISAIDHITSRSYQLLTAVLGTGDAECKYASDFSTNFVRLQYPSRGEDCLHTLLDILRRIFPALQFLESKCSQPATDFGWGDCLYGKDVPSAKQPCNEHPTDQSTCESKCRSKCQPTCQPNCQPTCQPTSPLMSYLNDCLPGHLPHQLQSVGCKSICSTCTKSGPGVPCMTPLGFRAFSGSVKTGRDICDIIREFLGNEYIPALFSLVPKPPFTLPEHFSFTLSLVKGWHKTKTPTKSLIKQSVESSIIDMSIALCDDPSNLTDALTDAYGADCSKCEHPHIANLTSSSYCGSRGKDVACAPYLSSLSSAVYRYMAEKHGKLYLSWAIYLPWSFHNYLRELLEAFNTIFCEDWGCRSCLKSANCRRGKHGLSEKKENEDAKPHCQCNSIAKCKGVAPTFYSYGFIIPDAWTLHEEGTRKTCSNFYDELKSVVESAYFTKLFEECDNFLKEIRWPFVLTLLALWSLSLLYLLHIAVVRLDVLRIRSHLRSPSSHRIAAQSLLAAARVKALANVKYFSP
ncbi:hypothetical protein, conserved [Babesia ovata]|uniref:C3H1-type domain-containing protein n=1 Tax=Babesia ovata TaxID=189622 RepID=A0A2H6KKG5_9APIC|nr:uncharacterized protein BOVATA_049740 [Babesia ovata]GBE63481.1 hypothetical protein, conserved [Babesia ovata]